YTTLFRSLELGEHAEPELGALDLSDPQPQELLLALERKGQRHIDGLGLNMPARAHFHVDRIQVDDRTYGLEWPRLPGSHLLEHRDRKSTRLNSSHVKISY